MHDQKSLLQELGFTRQHRPLPQLDLSQTRKPQSLINLEATVDTTPQLLRTKWMGPLGNMWGRVPIDGLSENAKHVLWGLMSCFEKAGEVREGIVKDVLWGFQVSGYDMEQVAYGLVDLKRANLVGFETPDGVETDENCTKLSECWLTYKPRLMEALHV